jgi:spore coat protein A
MQQFRSSSQLLIALSIALALPLAASADTVVLEPVKDNTLYEDAGGGLSNGAGDRFFSGRNGENGGFRAMRGLLEFDVAGALPPGATVSSATVRLCMTQTAIDFFPRSNSLHRVTSEWGEGTSEGIDGEGGGAPATTDDATWIHTFYPGSFWSSAGGDYVATASATVPNVFAIGFYSWTSAQLATDVQLFLDQPSDNHGWILKGDEATGAGGKAWDSRKVTSTGLCDGTDGTRPELSIEFTSTSTTGACCATDGSCSVVLDPGATCTTPSVYQGSGTTCTPNLCPQPTGACCTADATGTCSEVTAAACATAGGTFQGDFTTCAVPSECPVIPTPFVDALPLPAVATPVSGSSGGVATYDIAMREVQQQLHSELANPTTVWGYGDGPTSASFPGPTIEATSDQTVTVNWINDLRDTALGGSPPPPRTDHLLPVDLCPHGAQNLPKTVVHLHGAHVTSSSDGQPEATFLPGNQVTYTYPNKQLPATLWYHDHALGITRLNVYLGLAGFYLIRDAVENTLNLPSGQYEIPLAIQDRSFNPDGSFKYPVIWQDMFLGDTILVNGKVWPYHDVDQGKYRLRILNGSNTRTLTLQVCPGSNASPCPAPATFDLLGQDGGLLPAPVSLTEVTLAPAERGDIIVDFEPYTAGSDVYLVNSAPAPFPGTPGVGVVPDVMKFVVQGTAGFQAPVPTSLRPMEVLDEADSVVQREFELKKGPPDACSPFVWEVVSTDGLNGPVLGSRWTDITEMPKLLDTEVWRFINRSGMAHPMHMHLVMFQVLDRQTFDDSGGTIVPTGPLVPPPAHEAGWKDTVQVAPGEMVRVIARFEDYEGLFPYHCHILEHEDHEMMRQFLVPEPSTLAMLIAGGALVAGLARHRRAIVPRCSPLS